jgi:DNA-binding transcriptional LysR family regulator
MDFRQLEAYVRVIELASFSKAAEAITLSQPSVSTYINSLEKELETTLINRSTKEVSPTLAGKAFYEKAKEILALKCNTVEQIKNLSCKLCGKISILASTVPSQHVLPIIIACFSNAYPNILFNVMQADTFEVSRGIASQKAEIGFSGDIIENDKCEFKEFMSEKMVFIAPYNEEFLTQDKHSLDKLLYEHRFISREKGSGTRAQYENYFTEQNIQLSKINIYACFDNTQSIINAVINGLGVSVVSELAARIYIEQKMILPLKLQNELPGRKLYYVLKKNISHSHLISLFVEFLLNNGKIF